jgi:hypothetical protein
MAGDVHTLHFSGYARSPFEGTLAEARFSRTTSVLDHSLAIPLRLIGLGV